MYIHICIYIYSYIDPKLSQPLVGDYLHHLGQI